MLRKFFIIGGIALVIWGVVNIVFAISSPGRFDIPEWLGIFLYFTAFYLAPAALIVAIVGSIFYVVKSRLRK